MIVLTDFFFETSNKDFSAASEFIKNSLVQPLSPPFPTGSNIIFGWAFRWVTQGAVVTWPPVLEDHFWLVQLFYLDDVKTYYGNMSFISYWGSFEGRKVIWVLPIKKPGGVKNVKASFVLRQVIIYRQDIHLKYKNISSCFI